MNTIFRILLSQNYKAWYNFHLVTNKINGILFSMVVEIVKGHKNIDLYKFKSDSNQIVGIYK